MLPAAQYFFGVISYFKGAATSSFSISIWKDGKDSYTLVVSFNMVNFFRTLIVVKKL